jgi:putative sterol carrier protein
VDLKTGPTGSVKEQAAEKADCTITMKEEDFVQMMSGKLDAQKAFMEGKLKMSGNMQLAMKLGDIIKPQSKM